MNRQQRRDLAKRTKIPFEYISAVVDREENIRLREGDKVRINIEKIKEHPDYSQYADKYKEFVTNNAKTVFTVQYEEKYKENPTIVSFVEAPEWLFYEGDLIKVGDVRIQEGDRVKLNIEKIKEDPEYPGFTDKFKEFIDRHGDMVFTAQRDKKYKEKSNIFCFVEKPEWNFYDEELIKVEEEEV